jgi:methylated-DNA-[protein]-cysteine S-methyltransferase
MQDAGIYARESPLLDRAVQLGIASGRVISVSFPESVSEDARPDHPLLDRAFDYLGGAEDDFEDVPVALTVPTDRRAVLDAVRKIPYGMTASVEQVARMADLDDEDERDLDVVRTAIAENPVPLFVPDHRVRGVGGSAPRTVVETLRRLEG